jgi:cytochrome P450 TylI
MNVTASETAYPAGFNPFDVAWLTRIYEVDAVLRQHEPVSRPLPGIVYVTRHEDCRSVLSDVRTYRSTGGMRAPGVVVPDEQLLFNEMDPPIHPRMRRLLIDAFKPDRLRTLDAFLDTLAEKSVGTIAERLDAGEAADLVTGLTIPMGNESTIRLLGFPSEDADRVVRWTKEVMHSDWPSFNRRDRDSDAEGLEGFPEFRDYVDAAVCERRAVENEATDLVSNFARVEVEGSPLTDVQARTAVAHMFLAGISTATNLLGNALYELVIRPELYQRVRDDRSLVAGVIEESLRFRSPVNFVTRAVAEPVVICGVNVEPGERVVASLASAGRDEEAFGPDAGEFRPERENADQHLAFAPGAHYCVGRALARTEATAGINAVLDAFPELSLRDGPEFDNVPVPFEWGPAHLFVAR